MVTRNFINLLAMALQSGSNLGALLVRSADGSTRYLTGGSHTFYSNPTKDTTLTAVNAGISVGTGNTAATEDDWQLAEPITSGVNLTVTATRYGSDDHGVPYAEYNVTVTNTGSDPITVKEIGYKQTVKAAKYPGYSSGTSDCVCLIDRTVLDTPVTIAAGDAGIITYKLRTIPQAYETISGVQMASFTYGTDQEVAAILDAAAAGTIDLQTDAHWKVGEMRKIHIDAFTGGNNVACPAQDVFIAISSFEEYNSGLGNVIQFDFVDALSALFRMNSIDTTMGGYGATEMYNTTLPALVEALPSWLKTRLKTFSVVASKGSGALSTAETVGGNKLALRSEKEIFGSRTYSQVDEGTQVDYYKYASNRVKTKGVGGSADNWWERSAYNAACYCYVGSGGAAGYYLGNASYAYGVAPFGCL